MYALSPRECARSACPAAGRALARPLLALAILLTAQAAGAAQVWTAPAAFKVRPLAPVAADAPASAHLFAARNEFESFHVVVTGPASAIRMSVEGISDGRGNSISGRDVVLYREDLLNVPAPTGGDGAAGLWPDALVPDVDPIAGEQRNAFPFDVAPGQSRAVLVDIHVPADLPAGDYAGLVVVSGGVTAQVPFQLTVWDFALPSTATLRSAFGLAWNGPCLGHGDGSCTDVAAEETLRGRYIQAALDNRISIDIPYYTSPLRADGSGSFSDYDSAVGPFLDGTAPTRLAGAKLTAVEVEGVGITAAQDAAWSQHFQAKGWTPALFNYICDEPPMTCKWKDVSARDAISASADAALPRLVTTTTAEAAANGVSDISLYAPVINFMEGRAGTQYAGNQRAKYPAQIFWYQSCMSFGCSGVGPGIDSTANAGWPTYAVDSDGTRNRAMEWLSFTYDISGELYYETTMAYFTGDPWTNQSNFGGTGDGTLFYPGTVAHIGGKTEIPVESLRMKGIRDGMEDYELLHLAATLGHRDEALAIARGVFPTTYQATSTPAAIDAARAALAALILASLAPGTAPDAGTPSLDGGTAPDAGEAADAGLAPDAGDAVDSGLEADAGAAAPPPASGADAGALPPAQVTPSLPLTISSPAPGGCSSGGLSLAWLALPLLGYLRRRKPLIVE